MRPSYEDSIYRGKERIGIVVHPCDGARAVIINVPGWKGHINGYNNKYIALAEDMVRRSFAVVRMPNTERPIPEYEKGLLDDLRAVIEHTVSHSGSLASEGAAVYLAGFSMGGFAVAAVAAEYEQVKKILLLEPAGYNDSKLVQAVKPEVLAAYRGEAYIVVGDENAGAIGYKGGGTAYHCGFANASHRDLVVVPNCDHQFKGTVNGQIMAKAFLWAFTKPFPNPEGGLVLY